MSVCSEPWIGSATAAPAVTRADEATANRVICLMFGFMMLAILLVLLVLLGGRLESASNPSGIHSREKPLLISLRKKVESSIDFRINFRMINPRLINFGLVAKPNIC